MYSDHIRDHQPSPPRAVPVDVGGLYRRCLEMIQLRESRDYNAARDVAKEIVRQHGLRYPGDALSLPIPDLVARISCQDARPYVGKALWVLALFEKVYFKQHDNAFLVAEAANAVAPGDFDILRTLHEFCREELDAVAKGQRHASDDLTRRVQHVLGAIDHFLDHENASVREKLTAEQRADCAWCFENGAHLARSLAVGEQRNGTYRARAIASLEKSFLYCQRLFSLYGLPQDFRKLEAMRVGSDPAVLKLTASELKRIARGFSALELASDLLGRAWEKRVAAQCKGEFLSLSARASNREDLLSARRTPFVPRPPDRERQMDAPLPNFPVAAPAAGPESLVVPPVPKSPAALGRPAVTGQSWQEILENHSVKRMPEALESRIKDRMCEVDLSKLPGVTFHDLWKDASTFFQALSVLAAGDERPAGMYFAELKLALHRKKDARALAASAVICSHLSRESQFDPKFREDLRETERQCERALRALSLGVAHGQLKSLFTLVLQEARRLVKEGNL